jgi:hypothetical protein
MSSARRALARRVDIGRLCITRILGSFTLDGGLLKVAVDYAVVRENAAFGCVSGSFHETGHKTGDPSPME